jgi:putative ABC transport system permease protein
MLALLLLPLFNRLSGTDIRFSPSNLPQLVLSLTGVVLAAGVLSGTYPAFVLSGFKPVDVLKNKIRIGGSNWFTKSLVTFQFVLSLVLIVSTLVIFQQTKYIMNKNTGFDKENVVVIDASQTDADKTFPLFKQALSGNASVAGVASAAAGMGVGHDFLGYSDKGLNVDLNIVDGDYISVLGMKLMAGHTFRAIVHKDTINPMIINETMMRSFGWSIDNAVGKRIRPFQGETAEVIGVVKDFNYHALNEEIKNQAFLTSTDKGYNQFYVRLRPGHPATVLALIQKIWNDIAPGIPIKYSFLDENINGYYKQEKTWTGILASAAGICIFLACLGLLGLAALAAVNRRKEIGVRKVLGASVPDLVKLLLSGFLKLIALAVIIASPIAWFLTNYWLRDYANRIHISWTIFFMAGVFTFVMAIIAIGLQTIKAAWANPVNSLRTE